uniref:VWFA domain-containing protein n=1 Tax=Panagrolaimus davidi TaxID=227884 RepID=A0A914R3S7_9BILA
MARLKKSNVQCFFILETQMNFIKKQIGALNYPDRLRAEGGYGGGFNWNSGLNILQMQSEIDNVEQTTLPYSLSKQFSSLVTSFEALKNYSSNFGAIIFISDTSDHADLTSAYRILPKLKGIRLTFVLLGAIDSSPLRNFTSNFLYWQDLSQPAPDNWDLLSYHAYGCDAPDTQGSTKPVPTGPTTTPIPYYPCQNWIEILADDSDVLTADQFQVLTFILAGKRTNAYAIRAFEDDAIIYNWQNIGVTAQPNEWDMSVAFRCIPPPPTPSKSPYLPCESWIHFGIDDSNTLEKNEFYKETSFISSTIGNINFPKRIAAVGMYFQPVFWNNFDTVNGIQESVDYFPKGDGPYSLKQQFIALSANLQNTETGNIQIAAIIFISDTSDSALAGADQIFSQFKPVKITFVLFGNNTDSSKLTKYSSNFIAWNIYHEDQPDNWNNLYYSVYGCQ